MPKIFLIKNRLHQQQLRLQESQSLLVNKGDEQALCPGSPLDESEPLPLVARRDKKDGKLSVIRSRFQIYLDGLTLDTTLIFQPVQMTVNDFKLQPSNKLI